MCGKKKGVCSVMLEIKGLIISRYCISRSFFLIARNLSYEFKAFFVTLNRYRQLGSAWTVQRQHERSHCLGSYFTHIVAKINSRVLYNVMYSIYVCIYSIYVV